MSLSASVYDEDGDLKDEEEEEDGDGDGDDPRELVDPETLTDGNKTVIVGLWSTVKTITEALSMCEPGDAVSCMPGDYREAVVLDRPGVDVYGPPDLSCVVHQPVRATSVGSKFRRIAVKGGIDVRCGNMEITECDIAEAHNGVQVYKTANPTISKCTIHTVDKCNIYVFPGGRGVCDRNQLVGPEGGATPKSVGIYVNDGEGTVFKGNDVKGVMTGVYCCGPCTGVTFLNNTLSDISGHGVYVDRRARPTFRGNTVEGCEHYGVLVAGGSGGTFASNLVHGTVRIRKCCTPSLFDNTVVSPGKVIHDDAIFSLRGVTVKALEDLPKKRQGSRTEVPA